ncbi:hypothetical protein SAMN05660413_00025 [Salegentibacter flavus]|uniref:Uncharacterized protein n=2 Tax=Salegentibacter flavus TaxID=287099 RepID=A0A1I4XG93_9FLAO|nr:hypothetical protein SAMN05660413_00025 [Salegentibacter flavus]
MQFYDILKLAGVLFIPLAGLIYVLFKFWIMKEIQYSIKHTYDRQLEDYKNIISTRTKAALIAEVMAEWLSFPEDHKHLNKLSFEAFLWLPKGIAEDLSDLLNHKPTAKSTREILGAVRIHLLGEEQKIDPNDIIHFPNKKTDNS